MAWAHLNANAIRATERFLRDGRASICARSKATTKLKSSSSGTIGRRGRDYFRRKKLAIRNEYPGVYDGISFARAREIADDIAKAFVDQDLDAVFFVYNEFKSAITQIVRDGTKLLPIIAPEKPADDQPSGRIAQARFDFGLHVRARTRCKLLGSLLPRYLATQVWRTLLESLASEHGACAHECDGIGNQERLRADRQVHARIQPRAPSSDHQRADGNRVGRRSAKGMTRVGALHRRGSVLALRRGLNRSSPPPDGPDCATGIAASDRVRDSNRLCASHDFHAVSVRHRQQSNSSTAEWNGPFHSAECKRTSREHYA